MTSPLASLLLVLSLAAPSAPADHGLREEVSFDARDLYVDEATYVALDWPNAVFPQNRDVTFDGAMKNGAPMWRMHFRSAPGHKYIVDCDIYIRSVIGSDPPPKRVQVRAWQRKDGGTKDNALVDAWMKLDGGHVRFMLEPNGDRAVKIWLESRKSWWWTVSGCEIEPIDGD